MMQDDGTMYRYNPILIIKHLDRVLMHMYVHIHSSHVVWLVATTSSLTPVIHITEHLDFLQAWIGLKVSESCFYTVARPDIQ